MVKNRELNETEIAGIIFNKKTNMLLENAKVFAHPNLQPVVILKYGKRILPWKS